MCRLISFLFILPFVVFAQTDKEQIRLKIKEHLKEVRGCYEEQLKQRPDIYGKIVVYFEVDDRGNVVTAEINEANTTLKDKSVQSCITDKLKTWVFPPSEKGKTTAVNYPFFFSKSK